MFPVSVRKFIGSLAVWFGACASICQAENINGTWSFVSLYGTTPYYYDMTFVEQGGVITGEGGNGQWTITGSINGNQVSWHEDYVGSSYYGDRVGTISGDSMSGTWGNNFQSGTWTATRISGGGVGGTPGGKRGTAILIFCNRTGVNLGTAICSITVADKGAPPRLMPTGSVDLIASGGFFPGSASCLLQQTIFSPGVASCEAQFSVPDGFGIGIPFPIEAFYPGDANFDSSSTNHQLINASCIGDQNNPCSGDVAMSFSNSVRMIKNKITQIVLGCKKASTSPALSARSWQVLPAEPQVPDGKIPEGTCLTNTQIQLNIAEELQKLKSEEIKHMAELIKASEAKDNKTLERIKGLSDLTIAEIDVLRTTEGALEKVMNGSYKFDHSRFSKRSRVAAARKSANVIMFGSQAKSIRSGKQGKLSVSAGKQMKGVLNVFRRANVTDSLTLQIQTTNRKQLKSGRKGKATKIVSQVEAFLN